MPRPRFQNVDPVRQRALLDAAKKEFADHGYELASINTILDAAGFSKGSFYYYFDDKADLAATVFLEVGQPMAMLGELHMPSTPEEFWTELRRISFERLKQIESKHTEYSCLMRLSNAMVNDPSLAARVMPMFAPSRQKMASFLERGVAIGALRNDLPLAAIMAMMEAAKTAAYKNLFPGDRVISEAELESFTDLVIDLGKRISAPPKG
jgi:AcrR family transcriptional regulator